ncbi:hypothetical protein [Nocardioides sp. HB32]
MSRRSEPQSAANRVWETHARTGEDTGPRVAPPTKPPPPKRYRIRVEGLKPRRESVVSKWKTTTEALTDEERSIVRGYRLSVGGEAAETTRREIEAEVRRERGQQS